LNIFEKENLFFGFPFQKTLIRQLPLKFTAISESVVQKIEATRNIEQLDTWLAQVLVANSLADTDLVEIFQRYQYTLNVGLLFLDKLFSIKHPHHKATQDQPKYIRIGDAIHERR